MLIYLACAAVNSVDIFDAILPLVRSLPSTVPARSALLKIAYDSLARLHPRSPKAKLILATHKLYDAEPASSDSLNAKVPLAMDGATKGASEGQKASITLSGSRLVDELAKAVKALEKTCKVENDEGIWSEYVGWTVETAAWLEGFDADLVSSGPSPFIEDHG